MIILKKDSVVGLYTALTKAVKVNDLGSYRAAARAIKKGGKLKGYDVIEQPPNLSMVECEMIKFLNGDFDQTSTLDDEIEGGHVVIYSLGDDQRYTVEIEMFVTIRSAEPNHQWSEVEFGDIVEVLDFEGNKIKTQEYTEKLIKSKLKI